MRQRQDVESHGLFTGATAAPHFPERMFQGGREQGAIAQRRADHAGPHGSTQRGETVGIASKGCRARDITVGSRCHEIVQSELMKEDVGLARGRPVPVRLQRLVQDDGLYRLEAPDSGFTLAVSWDYLHHVPPLQAALGEIRRTLAPGGRFVFTLPFHYRASHTVSHLGHIPRRGGRLPAEFRGEIHDIGWDILAMLAAAGFTDSRAHHYWSDELGYLGAFNLVFSASC